MVRSARDRGPVSRETKPASDRLRKSVEDKSKRRPGSVLSSSGHGAERPLCRGAGGTEAGLQLDPNFTVARFRNERRSQNPTFLAQRERIYEGLSWAGVPRERAYHLPLQSG